MTQQTIADALAITLDDEYRARATYRAVLEQFGAVRPFINIVQAEEQHISALLSLHSTYGVMPVADRWMGQVVIPDTFSACCQAGVDAEISNYALYDDFLAWVQQPDIRQVFINLRDASEFNHLPAFQRCLEQSQVSNSTMATGGAGLRNNNTLWMLGGLLAGAALIYALQRSKAV